MERDRTGDMKEETKGEEAEGGNLQRKDIGIEERNQNGGDREEETEGRYRAGEDIEWKDTGIEEIERKNRGRDKREEKSIRDSRESDEYGEARGVRR
jgi:hypothetical protein